MVRTRPQPLKIVSGPAFLWPIIAVPGADECFVGVNEELVVKVSISRLSEVSRWRVPGFSLRSIEGTTLLLWGLQVEGWPTRAISIDGESLWEEKLEACHAWRGMVVDMRRPVELRDIRTLALKDAMHNSDVPRRGSWLGDLWLYPSGVSGQEAAYSLVNRSVVWHADLRHSVLERPPAFGLEPREASPDLFLGVSDKEIAVFRLEDGRRLWASRYWTNKHVRVVGDRLFMWIWKFGGSEEVMADKDVSHLVCVNLMTGETIYDRSLSWLGELFSWGQHVNNPAVGEEHIVFSSRHGLLAVFRMSDGELVWQYKYRDQLFDPVVVGNKIVVTSSDGNLLVFDDVLPVL
jgi:hypothetical protein